MTKLLIATEGKSYSTIAVQMGGILAQMWGAEVTLLTVVKGAKQRPSGEAILAEAGQLLSTAVPVDKLKRTLRIGPVDDEISAEAADGRYQLIILGDNQNNQFSDRLFGPTAERVLQHATCPVLIAKNQAAPINHLLLCDSGDPDRNLLVRLEAQLPMLLSDGLRVTILHVMSQISAGPGIDGKSLRATADELIGKQSPEGVILTEHIQQLAERGIEAQPKVRHGLVVEEILQEASSGDYDLLVIGAHRQEMWQRLLLDNLASKILLRIDRPILVIH